MRFTESGVFLIACDVFPLQLSMPLSSASLTKRKTSIVHSCRLAEKWQTPNSRQNAQRKHSFDLIHCFRWRGEVKVIFQYDDDDISAQPRLARYFTVTNKHHISSHSATPPCKAHLQRQISDNRGASPQKAEPPCATQIAHKSMPRFIPPPFSSPSHATFTKISTRFSVFYANH